MGIGLRVLKVQIDDSFASPLAGRKVVTAPLDANLVPERVPALKTMRSSRPFAQPAMSSAAFDALLAPHLYLDAI